jgi:hypothetical protein
MPIYLTDDLRPTSPESYRVRFTPDELRVAAANVPNNPKMRLMLQQGADAIETLARIRRSSVG